MAYFCGATHQNRINCSLPRIGNLLRCFGSSPIGRTCAHYLAVADDKLVTLISSVKMRTPQQKAQCVLWLSEFRSVSRVLRRIRTEWNAGPSTSKSIHQWERTSKEMGTLVSQTGKPP
ncbi:uncharacterized protein TNCV_1322551 [Trichonephila clavipes]|nr:uncharacterized protein TNCV_1322551 [Trichonephila clavipes]